MDSFYCEKCNKLMKTTQFYRSNNLEKYPCEGLIPICKKCLTLHVDNWDPSTYLWILKEVDVPYVADEWNKLLISYGKNKEKLTGTTILGRYLAKMRLKKWKDFRWKDNAFLQEISNKEIADAMRAQGYSDNDISKAISLNTVTIPEDLDVPQIPTTLERVPNKPEPDIEPTPQELLKPIETIEQLAAFKNPFQDVSVLEPPKSQPSEPVMMDNRFYDNEDDEYMGQLTDEDKTYLSIKWGKHYRAQEWISLENLWNDMLNSYDIQTAGDFDTLKLVCKTSLKANQLLDIGDIDGAQKATKMYENLMKSGKWTAAQNKAEENDIVDSVGELVALCETDGFIPRYHTTGPQDYADKVILDLQKYTHDLIINETGLGGMMETAFRQMVEESERIKEAAAASEESEIDKMFTYDQKTLLDDTATEITDKYDEFIDFNNELAAEDEKFFDALDLDIQGGK